MQLTWTQIIMATCMQVIDYIKVAIVAIIDCFAHSVYVYVPESSISNSQSVETNGDVNSFEMTNLD